jgi:hypothetical protein
MLRSIKETSTLFFVNNGISDMLALYRIYFEVKNNCNTVSSKTIKSLIFCEGYRTAHQQKLNTQCGDRTHDHTIKSRALYRLS